MKILGRLLIIAFVLATFSNRAAAGAETWEALLAESKSYFEVEKYDKALISGEKALTSAEKLYGPDHPNTADSLFNLAEIYRELGNYHNSESHFSGALRIRERILGPEHFRVAECYYGLAELMMRRGEYQLAENYGARALAIFQNTDGPESVASGKVNILFAEISKGRHEYREAESFGNKALEIFEKTVGPGSLQTGKALLLLASIRIKSGNYLEAASLLQRADEIYLKTYGKKRLDTGKLFYHQAEILRLEGEPKKAQGLYKKALKYFKKRSEINPERGQTLIALAACQKSDLKYKKAFQLHAEGLSILENSLGTSSVILEEPILEMSELSLLNLDYERAGVEAFRLFQLRAAIYGAKDLRLARALNRLAEINLKLNKLNAAEAFCSQALEIAASAGSSGEPEQAASLLLRAKLRTRQGDYPLVQSDLERASDIIDRYPDQEPALALELAAAKASFNLAQGNYLAAEPFLEKAIAAAEQIYGSIHPRVAELLEEMSVLYRETGRVKEAEAAKKRAIKIYSKLT